MESEYRELIENFWIFLGVCHLLSIVLGFFFSTELFYRYVNSVWPFGKAGKINGRWVKDITKYKN